MAGKGARVAAKVSDVAGLMRGQAAGFHLNIYGAQSLRIPGPAVFTQDRTPKIENPQFASKINVTLYHAGTRRFLSRTWTSEILAPIEAAGGAQSTTSNVCSADTAMSFCFACLTMILCATGCHKPGTLPQDGRLRWSARCGVRGSSRGQFGGGACARVCRGLGGCSSFR